MLKEVNYASQNKIRRKTPARKKATAAGPVNTPVLKCDAAKEPF
jgi:hypothetical protein